MVNRLDNISDEILYNELNKIRQIETRNDYDKAVFAETLRRLLHRSLSTAE